MIITALKLTNIKSYAQETEFTFHPGVNLIKGENGAGKSTLLEAIGYALFDHDPYRPISNFVRRGMRKGTIVVRFVSDDEREYEVTREVGGNEYSAYDPILHQIEARGKDDVIEWLRDRFRIDRDLPLDSLFQNAIGVPQGTMTADFLKTGKTRADVFNELLRVDSYNKAFDKLLNTVHHIDALLSAKATEAARLEGQLSQYPTRRDEHQVMVIDIDSLTQRVNQLDVEAADISARWHALESLFGDLQRVQSELARLRQSGSHQQDLRNKAAQARDAAQKAADILRETEMSFIAYQAAQTRLHDLEAQQTQRDDLSKRLNAVNNELTAVCSDITYTQQGLSQVEAAEAELQRLAPLVEQQKQLDAELNIEQERERKRNLLRDSLHVAHADRSEQVKRIEELTTQVAQRDEIEREIVRLKEGLLGLADELDDLDDQRVPLQEEKRERRSQVDTAREQVNRHDTLTKQIGRDAQHLKRMADREIIIRAELERRSVLETDRERISRELQLVSDAQTSAKTQIENAQRDLVSLRERQQFLGEQGSVCPVCQQPMNAHAYEQANAHYTSEIDHLERLTETARAKQLDAKAVYKTLAKTLEVCEQQLRELELPAALDRHLTEMEMRRRELGQAQVNLAALADAPDELLRLQQAESEVEQKLEALEHQRKQLERDRIEIQRELDKQHGLLAALPQQTFLDRAREDLAALEDNIKLWTQQLAELDDVDERLHSLQAELSALDDPRARLRQAQATADKRLQLQQQLADQQKRQQGLDAQYADLSRQLAQYDQLDKNLQTQREQKQAHDAAYRRYLAHEAEAGKLAGCQEELERIGAAITHLNGEIAHWQAQFDALCADYNAEEHQQVSNRKQQLAGERAAYNATLLEKQKRLAELKRELEQLQALEAQKAATERDVKHIKQRADVFDYFRSQIRAAGPHIRKRLVDAISLQAQAYFAEILDDRSQLLKWDPDTYDIHVEYSGETRTFNMLSGGEQMSAALAVRLALLTQMTSIRFMFLDEPTTNLDARRRGLLADKLGQIRSLQQLFVISHDETFEHSAAYTLFVRKVSGTSEVT